MADLERHFSKSQSTAVRSAGFTSLYDFITYIPKSVVKIVPLQHDIVSPEPDTQYLWQGVLTQITHRKNSQRFLILDFQGNRSMKFYLFSVASFTLKALKVGMEYQLLLTYRNGFWNILRFAPRQATQQVSTFILGKANPDDVYFLPKYGKIGNLKNSQFLTLHQKLDPKDYILDLVGLVPENSLIPQILNLHTIHHPPSLAKFLETKQMWLSLQFFLRLTLMKYMDISSQSHKSVAGELSVSFLQHLTRELPFELSISQKKAIWSILQDITFVEQT